LDQRIVELLAEQSELVVVGEVIRLNLANSRYGIVLHKAEFPFEIKTLKVLKGEGVEGNVLKVGVTLDEAFLYKEGSRYLFFLKTDPEKGKFNPEPLAQREWRAVADHFGVQRHTTALENMVSALEAKLLSCQNHRAHLVFSLRTVYQQEHWGELPYEQGVPGYLMLARYGARQQPGGLNCNHGAPESCIGGWQAVNLSPAKWLALRQAWVKRFGDTEIPFFWCGKNTGLGRRVVVSVRWASLSGGEGWSFEYTVVPEQKLRHLVDQLGECLAAIDTERIDIDVPSDVDWTISIGSAERKQ
jgi:hypothetical protein